MLHELDTVVLSRDIKEHNLRKGDIGAYSVIKITQFSKLDLLRLEAIRLLY